jgi:hypothetical protein
VLSILSFLNPLRRRTYVPYSPRESTAAPFLSETKQSQLLLSLPTA